MSKDDKQQAESIRDYAYRYVDAGLSVIPLRLDGSKKTTLESWKPYSQRLPTAAEVNEWFKRPAGIGLITGSVSGGIEVIDFDMNVLLWPMLSMLNRSLVERLSIYETPGGWHLSDRTSEIATKHGVSWMDYAGNCRLVFPEYGIYVRRSGIENPYGKQLPKVLNVFSSKSSRVVRAMLQEPLRGWKLNELAAHPDVRVSPGLMSRIKRSLVEGGYAVMQEGHIRLKRPDDLLGDWVNHYRNHKPREYSFYMRGELEQIEQQIALWCSKSTRQFALSRFSAAWRLAPEVRYNVASFMVPTRAILAEPLIDLVSNFGARKVDSGANLVLQISDDESYFSNRLGETLQTTSPLQTYLDLRAMDGRGEEAAMAIYEKYFKQLFTEATEQTAEHYEGN